MGRGEYSVGAERGGRGGGGGERGGHGRGGWGGHRGGGERGERGGRGWWGGRGWGGWGGWGGGWGGWGGGWPYYSSYSNYSWPYSYGYARPAYDITDGGYVYGTGQFYAPSYGSSWPSYALPFYGSAAGFPHWRSRRHFLHRHRRRIHHILGQDLD